MMGKNNHQQLVRDNTVVHYKAYKVGKHWVFAGITALTVGAGLLFGGSQQAQAATTETSDPTTSVADAGTSSDIQGKTVTLNATSTADTNAAAQPPVTSDETDANASRITTANSISDGTLTLLIMETVVISQKRRLHQLLHSSQILILLIPLC
ncbi:KxYKxGKxW signal peptide domain-containing protein [Secundilactobacillus similis]|uniref:KxYKxGKxW signal peptide domain-containing protein n=1 Tax=Secundilactobacillus similis TaxID=414682 RepID=UPI0006D1E9EC|nr:KxYKxGKxW signal peptide domain-containing protein [Secundilactobacillus similis]